MYSRLGHPPALALLLVRPIAPSSPCAGALGDRVAKRPHKTGSTGGSRLPPIAMRLSTWRRPLPLRTLLIPSPSSAGLAVSVMASTSSRPSAAAFASSSTVPAHSHPPDTPGASSTSHASPSGRRLPNLDPLPARHAIGQSRGSPQHHAEHHCATDTAMSHSQLPGHQLLREPLLNKGVCSPQLLRVPLVT